jgi:dynein heavy chain
MIPSLSVVLLHEMEKYNALLKVIASSLSNLERAVTGKVVMSQELDEMYTCFLMLKVPYTWKAYDSLKALGAWYSDLASRVLFIRTWLNCGLPCVFRLSAFIFPQGFLTGALQSHARKYKIPIDLLSFDFEVTEYQREEEVKEPAKVGLFVSGLFLEGAMWDKVLKDPSPGQLYKPMNIIEFAPTESEVKRERCYWCPVYKTGARQGVLTTTGLSSNFILAISLPCKEENPDKWTLRGTALLTEIPN